MKPLFNIKLPKKQVLMVGKLVESIIPPKALTNILGNLTGVLKSLESKVPERFIKLKEKLNKPQELLNKVNRKIPAKLPDFLGDLFGFFSRMTTLLIGYKVFEWISKEENKKKIEKVLRLFRGIFGVVYNFTEGLVGLTGFSIDVIMSSIDFINKNGDKLGKLVQSMLDFVGIVKQIPLDKMVEVTTEFSELPKRFKKIGDNISDGLVDGVTDAANEGIKSATESINKFASETTVEPVKNTSPPVQSQQTTELRPPNDKQNVEPKPQKVNTPKVESKPDKVLFDNPTVKLSTEQKQNVPKLATGGIVKSDKKEPSIKPLSSLGMDIDNSKFANDVNRILPEFVELIKAPFTVIGSGIVSVLKSVIVDQPSSNDIVAPIINRLNDVFKLDDTRNFQIITTSGDKDRNVESDLSNQESTSELIKYIGNSSVNINKSDDNNGQFVSNNDTTVRGLLADILNALNLKSGNLPKDKKEKPKEMSVGGWISGEHSGYPVSLDGKNTSFVGHGTEYVASHPSKTSKFVIPVDTPATKSNPNLTKRRIQEAKRGGYELPEYASGGALLVKPNGYNNGIELAELKTKSGLSYQVAKPLQDRFQAFVSELESTGYKIRNIGGYNPREHEDNSKGLFAHPYGAAIDINYKENPMQSTLKTDMPKNVATMAKKYGLGWGGNWRNVKDAMHFSAMIREGGTGFNGKEISKGVLNVSTPNTQIITNTSDKSTIDKSNTPVQSVNTSVVTQSTMNNQSPPEKDWGSIGSALKNILQMMGLGNVESKQSQSSKTYKSTLEKKITGVGVYDEQMPGGLTIDKLDKIKNDNKIKPIPKVAPLPKLNPVKLNQQTGNTNIINKKTISTNTSTKEMSVFQFNFSSDTARFTALNSPSGNVLDYVGV